jgi:hypothetical protein
MTFRVNHESSDNPARCPYRVVVLATGREIDWINQYLDYETVRRLADHTLQSYANELCAFSVGGRVFIALTRSPKMPSRNRHCSTMVCQFHWCTLPRDLLKSRGNLMSSIGEHMA